MIRTSDENDNTWYRAKNKRIAIITLNLWYEVALKSIKITNNKRQALLSQKHGDNQFPSPFDNYQKKEPRTII